MSRTRTRILGIALALAMVLPGLGGQLQSAGAQEGDAQSTAASFQDINFNELITSTHYLEACDAVRPANGPTDLATFKRTRGACWSGSGTVIDPSGIILTNAHVALDNKQTDPLWVLVNRTVDSRSDPVPAYFARAVLYSPAWGGSTFGATHLDLAVLVPALTLDGTPIRPGEISMRPLPMASEEGMVSIGEDLRNIGYPGIGGRLITITEGAVSGFEPDGDVPELGNAGWIKTDATIGGGISGGTTINQDGYQIGVPTELGDPETRPICRNESGQMVDCNVGQINHIRPLPEAFNLLQNIGLGDGMPDLAAPDAGTPGSGETTPAATDAVTVTGSIVSADTGQPVAGAWFIVLEPGVTVADYLNGAQDTVYTFATSGADGRFQLKKPVTRGQAYGVAVIARGYNNMQEDGRVLAPSDAPPVVTLPPIEMAIQR